MSIRTYTKAGNKSTAPVKLDKSIFSLKVDNHDLLKQAYVAYLANARVNLAQTRKRGEVSGGGKKPWRQKGTGRARFGSSRNPLWRGGGIAFGPTGQENYSHKLNVKSKRQALRQALSLANEADQLIIIESFDAKDGKVNSTLNLTDKLSLSGSTLIVVDKINDLIDRATRNLSGIKAVTASYLNVYDILNADNIIITQTALDAINEWLKTTRPAKLKEAVK